MKIILTERGPDVYEVSGVQGGIPAEKLPKEYLGSTPRMVRVKKGLVLLEMLQVDNNPVLYVHKIFKGNKVTVPVWKNRILPLINQCVKRYEEIAGRNKKVYEWY